MMTRAIVALLECVGRTSGLPNAQSVVGFSDRDWQELVISARRHRVSAFLYHRLQSHGLTGQMPTEVAEALRAEAKSATLRGLRLKAELLEIGRAFHEAGIPVIVLKGGHLASHVYEGVGLRWMGDLDLLVHRSDVERALAVLIDRGYCAVGALFLDVAFAAHHHIAPLTRADCTIELHWSMSPPGEPVAIDLPAVWSRSLPFSNGVAGLRVLAVNDLLVHLCVHAACNHNLVIGLQPLVDVAEICHSQPLDWGSLQDVADEWRAARPVSLILQIARRLVGARVPARADRAWRLEVCAADLMAVAESTLVEMTIGELSADALRLGEVRGYWRRLTTAVTVSLAPARVARTYGLELKSWWTSLMRVWRAIDLLWRYGPALVRTVVGGGAAKEKVRNRARLINWLRGSPDVTHQG